MTRQAYDWHDQILRLQRTVSWRVTAPLRLIRRITLAGIRGLLRLLRYLGLALLFILCLPLLPILLISIPFVLRRPGLRNRLGQRIKHYPALRARLRLLAYKLGFIPNDPRLEVTPRQAQYNPTAMPDIKQPALPAPYTRTDAKCRGISGGSSRHGPHDPPRPRNLRRSTARHGPLSGGYPSG